MDAAFASSAVGLVKESFGLKLDTPFKLLTSLLLCLTYVGRDRTPLQSIGWACTWAGWRNGANWVEPTRQWLMHPSHNTVASAVFIFLITMGVGFAASGTRAPYFAWLGVCGLIEAGAGVAAWWWLVAVFCNTSLIGRIRDREFRGHRWDQCGLTFIALGLAAFHLPITVLAVIIGEKQHTVPPTVRVEFDHEGHRDLDKRPPAAVDLPGRRAHPIPSKLAPTTGRAFL